LGITPCPPKKEKQKIELEIIHNQEESRKSGNSFLLCEKNIVDKLNLQIRDHNQYSGILNPHYSNKDMRMKKHITKGYKELSADKKSNNLIHVQHKRKKSISDISYLKSD